MKVQAVYLSRNPSADTLTLFNGHTPIARMHDQIWSEEVLGPKQRERWFNGEDTFEVPVSKIDEHCDRRFR